MSPKRKNGKYRALVHCGICFEHFSPGNMTILPCGHGFCPDDVKSMLENKRTSECPTCRKRFKANTTHKLFLEYRLSRPGQASSSQCDVLPSDGIDIPLSSRAGSPDYELLESQTQNDRPGTSTRSKHSYSEEVHRQAQHTAAGIHKLSKDSAASSVNRAGREIQKVLDGMERIEGDKVQELLRALATFMSYSAAPLYSQASSQRINLAAQTEKLAVNQERIQALENSIRQKDALWKDRKNKLEAKNAETEALLREALDTAGKAAIMKQGFQAQLDVYRDETANLTGDNQILKTKEKRLQRELNQLRRDLNEAKSKLAKMDRMNSLRDRQPKDADDEFAESGDREDTASNVSFDGDDEFSFESVEQHDTTQLQKPTSRTAKDLHRLESSQDVEVLPPVFSDWILPTGKRKREDEARKLPFPIKRDSAGRPLGNFSLGPRQRLNKYN